MSLIHARQIEADVQNIGGIDREDVLDRAALILTAGTSKPLPRNRKRC
jgi:hypothetical protein